MRHGRRLRFIVSACLFLLCDKLGNLSLQTMSRDWLRWHFIAHDVMALHGWDKSGHVQKKRVKQDSQDEAPQVCVNIS